MGRDATLTEEERERIRNFLSTPRSRRRPDDLCPDEEREDSERAGA